MKTRINIYIAFISFILLHISCSDELEFREPIDNDSSVPENIEELQVISLAGAVRIVYALPTASASIISNVKFEYTTTSGNERTVIGSAYSNSVLLEGFADLENHPVKYYTVTKSNVRSSVETIQVQALEAPIWKVQRSIKFTNQFGGYNMTASNPDNALVSIFVMEKNIYGEYEVENSKSVSTTLANVSLKIRNLDTVAHEYLYFVMDRWENTTVIDSAMVFPLFETEMDKSKFKGFRLPGDAGQVTNGAAWEYAWDNRWGEGNYWPWTSFTLQTTVAGPHMQTLDMGVEAKLSRFWYEPYPEFWWNGFGSTQWFFGATMKRFEVYGSIAPNPNGNLDDSWILLGQFEVIKPSGTPQGADTAEDRAAGLAGFNFELDINAPKVRYVRIRCLENFGGGTAQAINELALYGDPR